MKKLVLLTIILCVKISFLAGQSRFESEEDVFFYLNMKGAFSNSESGVTLSFSDLGYQMSTGSSRYYQPEAVVVSSTRAIVVFESISRPGVTVKFIVDSEKNVIVDRSDGSVFYAAGYEPSNNIEIESSENKPIEKNQSEVAGPIISPFKFTNLQDLKNDFLGTYLEKTSGINAVISVKDNVTNSIYFEVTINSEIQSLKFVAPDENGLKKGDRFSNQDFSIFLNKVGREKSGKVKILEVLLIHNLGGTPKQITFNKIK